jgi:hypothetical protein
VDVSGKEGHVARLHGHYGKVVGVGVVCVVACLWFSATPNAATGSTSKIEVKLVELASPAGQSGVRLRLTLVSGQAIEYVPEDAREADVVLRMTEMFVGGRARMFAEIDGSNVVRAVQIAGPSLRGTP